MKETTINLKDLQKSLDLVKWGRDLIKYDETDDTLLKYLFVKIAENNADENRNNLLDWAKDESNYMYVEDAINNGYADTLNYDVIKTIKAGQSLQRREELNDNVKDIILNYVYNYIMSKKGIYEISNNLYQAIYDDLDLSTDTSLKNIVEIVNTYI